MLERSEKYHPFSLPVGDLVAKFFRHSFGCTQRRRNIISPGILLGSDNKSVKVKADMRDNNTAFLITVATTMNLHLLVTVNLQDHLDKGT